VDRAARDDLPAGRRAVTGMRSRDTAPAGGLGPGRQQSPLCRALAVSIAGGDVRHRPDCSARGAGRRVQPCLHEIGRLVLRMLRPVPDGDCFLPAEAGRALLDVTWLSPELRVSRKVLEVLGSDLSKACFWQRWASWFVIAAILIPVTLFQPYRNGPPIRS